MNETINRKTRGTRGFTLIEMLVVTSLLSLLMLGMVSAMRTLADTGERIGQRAQRADEMRVASGFLRAILGRVSARSLRPLGLPSEGVSPYFFSGEADAATWIGILPARPGAGGRYFFRLAAEALTDGNALVIRFAPWDGTGVPPDWSKAQMRILIRAVKAFSLHYRDDLSPTAAWLAQWSDPKTLPSRIRIDLETAQGPWPLWIGVMRPTPLSDRSGAGLFSTGGG